MKRRRGKMIGGIDDVELIKVKVDYDLNANCNGLSIQSSRIAFPFFQYIFGGVIQTEAETA